MRPTTGSGNPRSVVASASSAVPTPFLPGNTGEIARPAEGSLSTGSEPEPIWLSMSSTVTV